MNKDQNSKKLKPVIFIDGELKYNHQNTLQQQMLLKAMMITDDPNELKKMIGVKTVAEVTRTLDKLQNRKDWYSAMDNSGISFSWIAKGIKDICDSRSNKAADKLNGYKLILETLGLKDYKDSDGGSRNWEDAVMGKIIESGEVVEEDATPGEIEEYEVEVPKIPEAIQAVRDEEKEIGKSLYE